MKKIIFSAALIAFGSFAMAQQKMDKMEKRDPAQMEQKRAEKMKMMKTELNLSDTQVAQLTALHNKKMAEREAKAPEMKAERVAKMEEMKSRKAEHDAEMKQILTPEQFQKWQAKKQDKKHGKRGMLKDAQLKNASMNMQ